MTPRQTWKPISANFLNIKNNLTSVKPTEIGSSCQTRDPKGWRIIRPLALSLKPRTNKVAIY